MNLKAKVLAQENKQNAQKNLSARIAMLESKGTAPESIRKDTLVRKIQGDIRDCNRRLAGAVAMEKLIAQKAQNKEAKAAAAKMAAEPAPKVEAKPEKKAKKAKEKKPAEKKS